MGSILTLFFCCCSALVHTDSLQETRVELALVRAVEVAQVAVCTQKTMTMTCMAKCNGQLVVSWPGWTLFPEGEGARPGGTRGCAQGLLYSSVWTVQLHSDFGQGVSVAKIYKSDKIKAIFIWEAEWITNGIGPCAYAISVVGSAVQGTCRCEPTLYCHSHSRHLHFTHCSPYPPSFPCPTWAGGWRATVAGCYIESRLILFYMLLS